MSRLNAWMAGALAMLSVTCVPASPEAAHSAPPAWCVPPQRDVLQEISGTSASPYFVHHPAAAGPAVATVVFLPGGSGSKRSAQRVWDTFLAGGKDVERFRVVVPYWPDVGMDEDFHRTLPIIDEVLACNGGEPRDVHLAGFSNGGHDAFDLMLEHPERFATLLGAPGEFQLRTTSADLVRLRGKAVFNGIGEKDDEFWHKGVRDAHEMLLAAGVESVYVEFKGQGHGAAPGFPKDLLFEFWTTHRASMRR
jgi:predicted esterase